MKRSSSADVSSYKISMHTLKFDKQNQIHDVTAVSERNVISFLRIFLT